MVSASDNAGTPNVLHVETQVLADEGGPKMLLACSAPNAMAIIMMNVDFAVLQADIVGTIFCASLVAALYIGRSGLKKLAICYDSFLKLVGLVPGINTWSFRQLRDDPWREQKKTQTH